MDGRTIGRRLLAALAVILLVQLALPAVVAAAPTSWRMVDLGAGDHSTASAINDRGQVVGTSAPGAFFVWEDGRATIPPALTIASARSTQRPRRDRGREPDNTGRPDAPRRDLDAMSGVFGVHVPRRAHRSGTAHCREPGDVGPFPLCTRDSTVESY